MSTSTVLSEAEADRLSDADLVARSAAQLRIPRAEPADSFVLHAPLELLARAALLPRVRAEGRAAARSRITDLANEFIATGPAVVNRPEPTGADFDSLDAAAADLVTAIDAGDLERADDAATWLGQTARPSDLRRLLAGDVLGRLSAAAHASILLYQLPRISPRDEITGELLRGLARELARYPDWRLHWIDRIRPTASRPAGANDIFDALAAARSLAPPASTFIFPLMSDVDTSGIAESILGDVVTGSGDVAGRGRAVLRSAAWSMLLEPPDHAAYGWSHCLTLPQAVLGIAAATPRPDIALAVAATYVIGFRSGLAVEPLDATFTLADPHLDLSSAIEAGPDWAAAAVWHASETATGEIVTELVTRASIHPDAHFAKYTLACLDAAADDSRHRRLFLAAAARLAGMWARSSSLG